MTVTLVNKAPRPAPVKKEYQWDLFIGKLVAETRQALVAADAAAPLAKESRR